MTRQKFFILAIAVALLSTLAMRVGAAEKLSELTVKLNMQKGDYIEGERINAVVDVANASPDPIDAREPDKPTIGAMAWVPYHIGGRPIQ